MDAQSGSLEGLELTADFWGGRRVFLTGHTGFKGSWLALWLGRLGTRLHGYALDPSTDPSLFVAATVKQDLEADIRGDLGDLPRLRAAVKAAQPEIVFHLAAQPLVRESYQDPVGTFATNVLGTAHLLDSLRGITSLKAVVVITTDKVYHNEEWAYPYRESDRLGGHDPYSASKAAAEIVTASYRSSFFNAQGVRVATARAGNAVRRTVCPSGSACDVRPERTMRIGLVGPMRRHSRVNLRGLPMLSR